ncbi:hypothetical protein SELMODRAFT_423657 [Selaginella moellendorffii]|uniref:Uncharacterized protein n=1 Tax=Selaginella moellendorffii TaxID=88036 RepID=D8SME6_SELML|nr:hypothetical protein SELMODRAFT_423657 [Selaginella moellendorffii]
MARKIAIGAKMAELDVAREDGVPGHCVALTRHGEEDLCLAQMPTIPIIDVYAQIVDVAEVCDGRGGYVEFTYLEAFHKANRSLNHRGKTEKKIRSLEEEKREETEEEKIPSERKPWKKLQSGEVVFAKEAKGLYDRAGRDFVAEFKRRQRAGVNDECLFCRNHDGEKMIGRAGANSNTTRPWVYLRREHEQTVLSTSKKREMKLCSDSSIGKANSQESNPEVGSDGCGDYKADYARRSLSSGGMREVFGQEPQGIMADGVESAARGGALGQEHVKKRMAEFGSAKASLEKQVTGS